MPKNDGVVSVVNSTKNNGLVTPIWNKKVPNFETIGKVQHLKKSSSGTCNTKGWELPI